MMSLTFGLFTQVSGSGPLGPLVVDYWSAPQWKTAEFANNVDPDEVAHNEPPRLDLHC